MKSNVFVKFILPLALIISVFAACSKDATTTTTELVDEALYSIQERGSLGSYGCFELVFPVSFTLPDSSEVTVASYDEIKDALKAYFEANGAPTGAGNHHGHGPKFGAFMKRIDFVYPISVLNSDGEVITVADQTELKALRSDCAGSFSGHGPNGHGNSLKCFDINFPISLVFPDGTTSEAADKSAFRDLIKAWKEANPGHQADRPSLVFPISVTMDDDGSVVTVNSQEEFRDLKEGCK